MNLKNRIGLFGASAVGFLVALAFGALKQDALRHSLVLYFDAMLCLSVVGIVASASMRGVPAGEKLDSADQKKVARRALILMSIVGLIAYGLEFF